MLVIESKMPFWDSFGGNGYQEVLMGELIEIKREQERVVLVAVEYRENDDTD